MRPFCSLKKIGITVEKVHCWDDATLDPFDSKYQFSVMPDRFEKGIPNAAGIAGLKPGVEWVVENGREKILKKERQLASILIDGLSRIRGLTVYCPTDIKRLTRVVSFTIEGIKISDIGSILDDENGIIIRVGLQCAPPAHITIETAGIFIL